MSARIAIIGGTGVCDPSLLRNPKEQIVETPYGSVKVYLGNWGDREVVFSARHGAGFAGRDKMHYIPPHRINYRANIWALGELGANRIIATAATGSLNPQMEAGSLVLLTQFIDFTKTRAATFFDEGAVVHVDMTEPYCPELRNALWPVIQGETGPCFSEGTYACTEGPRFETAAEIRAFKMLGTDLVGMTSVPEVVLAREMEICYAGIAIVTNMAAGIAAGKLTATEVEEMMATMVPKLISVLEKTLSTLPRERSCACKTALGAAEVKKADKS